MYKQFKIISVLSATVILLATFVGCSYKYDEIKSDSQLPDEKKDVTLYKVTSPSGLNFSKYAFTNDGFYEILEHSTREGNILYTDVNLKRRMYLTADLGIDPSSSDSTSYIDNISEGSCIGLTKENLYVFKRGSAQENSLDENKRTAIEQRDLAGGNIKKVYLEPNMTMIEGSTVVADEENIYFCVMDYSFGKDGKTVDGIVKIISLNQKDLKLQVIYEFDKKCYIEIKGVFEDNFIITRHYSNEQNEVISDIIKFNLKSKNINVITELKQFSSIKINSEIMYIFNNTDFTLESINLKNGEFKIYDNLFKMDYDKISLVSDIYDNHLFFSVSVGSLNEKWALNLTTMELKKLEIYNDENFVGIYGEIKEYFLVITGMKVVKYMDTAPDKVTKFEAEKFVEDIRLILKSDYWNNMPNYIEIESDEIIYK